MRKYQFILTTITLVSGSVIKSSNENIEMAATTEAVHSVKNIHTTQSVFDNTLTNSSNVNSSTVLSNEKFQTTVQNSLTTTTSMTTEKKPLITTTPMTTRNAMYAINNIRAPQSCVMNLFNKLYDTSLITTLSKLIKEIWAMIRNLLTTAASVITGKEPLTTTTLITTEKNPLTTNTTMTTWNAVHVVENTHAARPFVINLFNNSYDMNLPTTVPEITKHIMVPNSLTTATSMTSVKYKTTSGPLTPISNDDDDDYYYYFYFYDDENDDDDDYYDFLYDYFS